MSDDFATGAELAERFDADEDQIASLLAVGGFLENILAGGYPRDEAQGFLARVFASPTESPDESTVAASATGGVYIARTTAASGTKIEG